MTELFAIAVWASLRLRLARTAFSARLPSVMRKIRQGVVPAMFVVAGFATVHAGAQHAGTHARAAPGRQDRASLVEMRARRHLPR